jgi:hypothetical protein
VPGGADADDAGAENDDLHDAAALSEGSRILGNCNS